MYDSELIEEKSVIEGHEWREGCVEGECGGRHDARYVFCAAIC